MEGGLTQPLWTPLHGASGHHRWGGGGWKGGARADGCLGPIHPSLLRSHLQPLRNRDGVSWVNLIRCAACPSPPQGREGPHVPGIFKEGRSRAAVCLYVGPENLCWSLQRPPSPKRNSWERRRAGASFPKHNFHLPPAPVSGGGEQKSGSSVGLDEPKTCTFLTDIVQRNTRVASLAALGGGKEPEGIFS